MTNAALYFHPDAYDTSRPSLMGRHSAGESFLRGFIRHAAVDRLHLYDAAGGRLSTYQALLQRVEPTSKPVNWIARRERNRLAEAGCLNLPVPGIGLEAWHRRALGARSYSLCGITHTTATHRTMDAIAELVTGPTERWDALICTSAAVRRSVEVELDAVREDLRARLGATRFPEPELATIPLGINTADFAASPEHRRAWREKLNIPQDAVVCLYVGRLNPMGKMNPALMAIALEDAAKVTGKDIYWVVSGWAADEKVTEKYHADTRAFCPSLHYRSVDGRPAETRFSIWSVADFFISLSDNIQETFGLTPAEAMAAGLPCVVTDWDGYRETVRPDLDGFRIPTYAPTPGVGRDISYHYASEWVDYSNYIAAAAQVTAVDLRAATEAIVALVTNPELRRTQGASAQRHAAQTLDWQAIIPQYQALWAELGARRAASRPEDVVAPQILDNPRRMDPFTLFASYPTHTLSNEDRIGLPPGMTWSVAQSRLSQPLAQLGRWALPSIEQLQPCFDFLAPRGAATVAEIVEQFPAGRRPAMARALLHLAKYGVVTVTPHR